MTAATRFATRSLPALMLLTLAACGGDGTSPEDQVRAWLASMEEAAEAKDRGEVMAGISTRYADGRGNSREEIDKLLRVYFLRSNTVTLLTSIDDITVIGDSAATVDLTVGMAGTNDSALGISADAYRFELELEAEGDDWELISARWAPMGEQAY